MGEQNKTQAILEPKTDILFFALGASNLNNKLIEKFSSEY